MLIELLFLSGVYIILAVIDWNYQSSCAHMQGKSINFSFKVLKFGVFISIHALCSFDDIVIRAV